MRNRISLLVSVLSLSAACVPRGKYDAAVRGETDARAQLQQVSADDASRQKALADLQAKLEEQTALNRALEEGMGELGKNAESLAAERGSLASALEKARARQAAAESRARLFHDLAERLKAMVDAGDLKVALRDGRMVLQLPSDVLFESGQTEIRARGLLALKQVASVLRTFDNRRFQVAGHTDDVPIETERFPSNWELSAARALEVVRVLRAHGVNPAMLSAAGYGEYDPVAPNKDSHERARNRRIEITLVPNVDELVAVPALP